MLNFIKSGQIDAAGTPVLFIDLNQDKIAQHHIQDKVMVKHGWVQMEQQLPYKKTCLKLQGYG